MSGRELAIVIAAVLAGAVALGWVLHWLWVRLSGAATTDAARLREMSNRLHEAERIREAAEEARDLTEDQLASREVEMERRLAAMQARLDGAAEGREAELAEALRESKADAEASMLGLHNARRRIMELEAEVEKLNEASR